MGRLMLVLAVCLLPLVSAARPLDTPLSIEGRVYCDTCRAGFETSKTIYIAGAEVELTCKDRSEGALLYTRRATTDSTGTYSIPVYEDHENQVCDVKPVKSPLLGCSTPSAGRDAARVPLTTKNGIASNTRYANAIAFEREEAMSGCAEVLRQYQEYDE